MGNRKLSITEMGRMSADAFRAAPKMPLVVVLDDVRSMYNVGSIFRTADAFRVERICLCGITAQPPHPEIHKTALGAESAVAWQHVPSALEAVHQLRAQGYTVFSVEQCEGSTPLHDLHRTLRGMRSQGRTPRQGIAIVLGNEVKGVHQAVVDASDGCIEIPQFGTKHSLNVSTTAAIVRWELAKEWFFNGKEKNGSER